jgi:endonuclease/exonuclease/phosphatase family metal-dependent hydrolase
MEVNLEDCSGCGVSGWGWQDNGWGVGVLGPLVYFGSTGTQTLRIQTREDGFSFDQIVLSPSTYLSSAPGASKNDGVILWYTEGAPAPAPTPTPTPTPAPVQNQSPQLSISATPSSGLSPLLVTFTSSASDPDGYIASYFWNFGDNTSSNLPSPQHWYATGSYTASLTVTDNSGASITRSVTITVTAPTSTPPPSTAQIKVLSWNVSFGQGTDGQTNWNRIATYIANFNPDLVALCEMPPADIGNLVSLLQQKTGRTWYSHFVAKWPGYEYEGNLILSKYSFSSTSARYMSYERSVAQATVNIGGKNVNFFSTHLDHTSSSLRYQQVTELQNFTSGFSETKIVAGDFNAGPDLSEAIHMAEQYYDSWVNAMNIGTATAYPDNPVYMHTRTRRGRIDYVWLSKNSNSVIKSTQIPDVRDLNNKNVVITLGTADDWGVRPSDHNPTIAIIELR